ncbi:MAG: hypothetical protein JWO99_653 [Candidatus Saccharibacteria bacterium]|nr:hypothetical protein [Candidatus Saccharibacteria bacterium]
MSRLPTVNGDNGTWGTVLNDFLSVAHTAGGTLVDGTVSNSTIVDGTIALTKLATSVQTSLGKADAALAASGLDAATATLVGSSSSTATAINSKISAATSGSTNTYILAPADPDPTTGSPAGLYFRRTT